MNDIEKRIANIESDLNDLKQFCIINIKYLMELLEPFNKPTE